MAKSKFEGAPAPKSLTRTGAADGAGLKYSFEAVAPDGSKLSYSFTSNLDGKDSAGTVTLKKVSATKTEGVTKKGGKEVGSASSEVSKDGKTTTVTTSGTLDGKEVKAVPVYKKQ